MEENKKIKNILQDIILSVAWDEISKHYFGKSNSWLYHKLNGIDENKNITEFSEKEKEQLKEALMDLSSRLTSSLKKYVFYN